MDDWQLVAACGLVFAAAAGLAERLLPARRVPYKQILAWDLIVFAFYMLTIVPLADRAAAPVQDLLHRPRQWVRWPLWLRLVLYYLLADLASYLVHRLMHTRWLWRVHKWHHSPRHMYFMTGVRASWPQQFLFNAAPFIAMPFLVGAPHWCELAIAIEGVFRNDWMHMNVSWQSRWLELILVTPRYHHVHHSSDPALHNGNYGSLLTIWDRLFRTRVDPDTVPGPLIFGTGEHDSGLRMMLGI